MATKDELRAEIEALRLVGAQMANVCFNLGQAHGALRGKGPEMERFANTMWELRKEWDAIKRADRPGDKRTL